MVASSVPEKVNGNILPAEYLDSGLDYIQGPASLAGANVFIAGAATAKLSTGDSPASTANGPACKCSVIEIGEQCRGEPLCHVGQEGPLGGIGVVCHVPHGVASGLQVAILAIVGR